MNPDEDVCKNCLKLSELGREQKICLGTNNKQNHLRLCVKGKGIWFIFELEPGEAKSLGVSLLGAAGILNKEI